MKCDSSLFLPGAAEWTLASNAPVTNASAKSSATNARSRSSASAGRKSRKSQTLDISTDALFPIPLTSSPADSHALTSALLANVKDWLATPLGSGSKCIESRWNLIRELSSSKMFPAFSPQPQESILESFSAVYLERLLASPRAAGKRRASRKGSSTTLPGECLTLSFSESPSSAIECFLPQVLQPPESIPPKYFLSAKACRGILRRAAKRGKTVPEHLREALELVANGGGGQVSSTLSKKFNGAEQLGRLVCGGVTPSTGGADENDAEQSRIVGALKSQGMQGYNVEGLPYLSQLIAPTMNCHLGDKQGLENQHIDSGGGISSLAKTLTTNNQRIDFETETLIPCRK
jgi:hypothetical protein